MPDKRDAFVQPDGLGGFSSRPFAEPAQAVIDAEVSWILREAEQRAVAVLTEHREVLDSLVDHLIANETVDGSQVYALAGRPESALSARAVSMALRPRRGDRGTARRRGDGESPGGWRPTELNLGARCAESVAASSDDSYSRSYCRSTPARGMPQEGGREWPN